MSEEKLTNNNLQEYINAIYSVMHDEDEIEKLREESLSSENFRSLFHYEWKKLTNENKNLLQIIQMLKELAVANEEKLK